MNPNQGNDDDASDYPDRAGIGLADDKQAVIDQKVRSIHPKYAGMEALFRDLIEKVTNLLKQRFPPDVAEDAALEAFVRVSQYLYHAENVRSVKALIFRAATNVACDMMQQDTSESKKITSTMAYRSVPTSDPAAELEMKERQERLHQALDCLPTEQRRAVELRCLHGMTFEEIARQRGCAVSTVRSNYHHGVMRLRERLL